MSHSEERLESILVELAEHAAECTSGLEAHAYAQAAEALAGALTLVRSRGVSEWESDEE